VAESNASAIGKGRPTLPSAVGIPIVVALILIFIALNFPWDSLTRRIEFEISAASGGRVSIQSLAPALTARGPVLRALDVRVEHPAIDQVRLRELELAPRFSLSWFSGNPRLRIWADGDLGIVDGVFVLGAAPEFVGNVERVDLARLPLRLDASRLRLAGTLDARTDVVLDPGGTLKGRVEFESLSLVIESDTLPMPIPFTRTVGVVLILDSGATQIESMVVEGPLVEGNLSGEIGLVHRSQSPPIDLELNVRIVDPVLRSLAPAAGLPISRQGAVDVRVRGTIDAPEVESLARTGTRRAGTVNRPARTQP
jgi:type II secretion system protein N